MNFVKVLKLTQRNLDGERKVVDVTEKNITKLSTYNFLIKTLENYNDRKFKNDEMVTEFIKCNLPKDEEQAHKQWFDGIEYEGYRYYAWFATTGGMKKEDNGICDTIFIREDYKEFAELVEQLISLGKFGELEKEEKVICINKDVLSRLSLITSDLITEIDMPNFIVLPQATYHIIKEYKTVEPFTYKELNKKGEEVQKIDYNLVDVNFNNEIDVFDGGGIATPKVFESIGKTLGRNDIEFAIIRGYGLAIKGLITKFNIIGYLDVMYKDNTEYCRKVNGQYQILDRWGQWQIVTDNTILLNDSMVKLAKYFNNMTEYKKRMEKLNNDKWSEYYKLLNKLYITKVNKPANEIKDYRRTNYQLINALALTPYKYSQLIKQDLRLFNKILKPYTFEKDTAKFVACTDYINLFYKQCVNVDLSEEDDDFEEKIQEQFENVVNKVHELININQEFVKLDYVKRNLRKLIEKKVRELCTGKPTIKAKCQFIAIDPISYMNYAITREQGDNGLKERQFYSADCNDGDIRTIQRNPLAAYSEIHNVKFVRNNFFDDWLSNCKELIYFNQKSDFLMLLSSADCDGDFVTTINEPVIRDAVVTPADNKYFITKNDGEKVELSCNKENRFISTFRASGNLIGSIAIKSANVNCNCQIIPNYYDTVNKKFVDYITFKVDMEFDNEWSKEETDKFIQEKLENKEWIKGYNEQCEKELQEYIKQKYYEYEKEIYILLYNSMCAIDAPKTLKFLDKKYMEVIDKKYHHKVNFLQYKENKEDVVDKQYFGRRNNLLDFFSRHIQKKLLNIIEESKPQFSKRSDVLQKFIDNEDYCKETIELCKKEINKLYEDYNAEREEADKECRKANKKLWDNKKFHEEEMQSWNQFEEDEHYAGLRKNAQEKYKKYKEIDKKYNPIANSIVKRYDKDTISKVIADMEKCTENFILTLFFTCLQGKSNRYIYQKFTGANNQNIEDFDIKYLYENYRKIEVKGFDNSKVVDRIAQEDKIRLNLEAKIRFRMNDSSIVEEISSSFNELEIYNLNLSDNRIELFEEFADIVKNKETIRIVDFEKKKDGTNSITKKSFGVIVEV